MADSKWALTARRYRDLVVRRRAHPPTLASVSADLEATHACDLCGKDATHGVRTHDGGTGVLLEALCLDCHKSVQLGEYELTGRLTSRVFQEIHVDRWEASRRGVPMGALIQRISDSYDAVTGAIKGFEARVWFGGLQAIVRPARDRGFSIEDGGFKLLTYSLAGRCMITLSEGEATVSFLADESATEASMGLQSIGATEAEALALTHRAVALWEAGKRPDVDGAVHMVGF